MDFLSGGIAGTRLAESAVGNMVLHSIAQAVMGSSGEALAQVSAGQEFNIAEVVLEGLAEFVTAPVEVGGMAVSRIREAIEAAQGEAGKMYGQDGSLNTESEAFKAWFGDSIVEVARWSGCGGR